MTATEMRGKTLMKEFEVTIDKRMRQEKERLRSAELGRDSGLSTDRAYEDFEQDQKSQGVLDSNEAHQ